MSRSLAAATSNVPLLNDNGRRLNRSLSEATGLTASMTTKKCSIVITWHRAPPSAPPAVITWHRAPRAPQPRRSFPLESVSRTVVRLLPAPTPGAPMPLLTAAAIAVMPATSKVHFLNDNGRRLNRSLGDATGLTGLGVHLVEVPVGAESTELHRHHHEDEAVYVLAGHGVAVLDDAEHPVGPGDFLGLPAGGEAHLLRNDGPEVLKLLVIGQRLDHDVADYPRKALRLYRDRGRWDLVPHDAITDPKTDGTGVGEK